MTIMLITCVIIAVVAIFYYVAWDYAREIKIKEGVGSKPKEEKKEPIKVNPDEQHMTVNCEVAPDGEIIVDGITKETGSRTYYFPETHPEEETTSEHTIVIDEPETKKEPEEVKKITVDVRDYFAGKVHLDEEQTPQTEYQKMLQERIRSPWSEYEEHVNNQLQTELNQGDLIVFYELGDNGALYKAWMIIGGFSKETTLEGQTVKTMPLVGYSRSKCLMFGTATALWYNIKSEQNKYFKPTEEEIREFFAIPDLQKFFKMTFKKNSVVEQASLIVKYREYWDGEPEPEEEETVIWQGDDLGDEKSLRKKCPVDTLEEDEAYVYYKQNLKRQWHKGIIIADKSAENDFTDPQQSVVRVKYGITTKNELRYNFIIYTRKENGTSFYRATEGEKKYLEERVNNESE